MKLANMKVVCCNQEWPAEEMEVEHFCGGCDSCGHGSYMSASFVGTCGICGKKASRYNVRMGEKHE